MGIRQFEVSRSEKGERHAKVTCTWLFAVAMSTGLACSGSDEYSSPVDIGAGGPGSLDACIDGEVGPCGVTLEQANGTISCYRGTKICQQGRWGACENGTTSLEVNPHSERFHEFFERAGQALSTPTACTDNPCDPSCLNFIENPPDIGLGGGPGGPPTSVPDTGGCAHGVCTTGTGLDSSCDPCAADICALSSDCCDDSDPNGWDQSCADLVFPVCAGSAPELGLCDFALFSESSITLLRDSMVTGGAVGATTTLSLQEVSGSSSLVAGGAVTLDQGNYSGSIYSGSTVTLMNGATSNPDATFENLTTTTPSIPTRSVSCLAPSGMSNATGPSTLWVNPGDADEYVIDNPAGQIVLDGPGDYGNIVFSSDGTLVFASGGTYTFDSLNVTANSPTLLFPPGEQVVVETCSGLQFQNGSTVSELSRTNNACASAPAWDGSLWWYTVGTTVLHGGSAYQCTTGHDPHSAAYEPGVGASWNTRWTDLGPCFPYSYSDSGAPPAPGTIQWYTNSTSTITLGPGALGSGILIAPHATVAPQTGTFHGLIFAESVAGQTDFIIDGTGLVGAACEGWGLGGGSATCPVSVMPPLLNEPCVTGRDCQANHRCMEPVTSSSCDHSKCEPGDPLDPNCDECVERICAIDSDCCGDSWSSNCIDMVATVCDATCDSYACLHQPCESGGPLEATCDACIATVCATSGFEGCCSGSWTTACILEFRNVCGAPPVVTEPPAGGSICDYSAYGQFELQTQGATLTGGWVGSPSSASQNIANSQINGNATSSGSLNAAGSTITGDLLSGSGSIASGTVLGTIYTGTPPSPALPNKSLTGCTAGAETRSGVLAPGSYGDVSIADGQTLTLSAGTYQFNSLTVGTWGGTGATLELPSDGSVVEINVCGDVHFMESSVMSGLTPSTSAYVSVYTEGFFAAHGDNLLYGLILSVGTPGYYAGPCFSGDPCNLAALQEGSVYIGPNSTVYGIVGGQRRLDVRGGSTIDATGMEDACKIIWEPPDVTVTTPACPVTLVPDNADESGTCEENTTGYEDITCSGHDLALGLVCDDEVPVCNHGTTSFNGTVEVGYWDAAQNQLSTPSPSSPDGICSAPLTIAPGTCETLICTGLPTSNQTLMVDPQGNMSECDDRRLDNWTFADGASCSLAATVVETQVYEAVCPSDSQPAWGLLTWNTSTPGASTITFSARTAPTVSALSTAPSPVVVGTASAMGAPNTQVCAATSAHPDCPVDLTAELGLSLNQDPVLELSIQLDGDTSASPILEDWLITYSCLVDQ